MQISAAQPARLTRNGYAGTILIHDYHTMTQ